MSKFLSNDCRLEYNGTEHWFFLHSFEDDSFRIICLKKQAIYKWEDIEKFIGTQKIFSLAFQNPSDADRQFLVALLKDQTDTQKITLNGIQTDIRAVNPKLGLSYINGGSDFWRIDLQFKEKNLNRTIGRTYTLGSTDSAAVAIVGYNLTLKYNYGDGNVSRRFYSDNVNSFDLEIQRKDFEYADYDEGQVNLGLKTLTSIVMGAYNIGTPSERQDDRDWIKEFVLAPTKTITPLGQIETVVTNDFEEIIWTPESGFADIKSTTLNFKEKLTTTVVPTV